MARSIGLTAHHLNSLKLPSAHYAWHLDLTNACTTMRA